MKNLILLTLGLFIFSCTQKAVQTVATSQTNEKNIISRSIAQSVNEKERLRLAFNQYANTAIEKIDVDLVKEFQSFSTQALTNQDQVLLDQVLYTLVMFDSEDPSRTSVMYLGASYKRHTALYQQAFTRLSQKARLQKASPDQLKAVREIQTMMRDFANSGNG